MKRYPDLSRDERIGKVMGERRTDLALVLENLNEELNIAAILRSAEGFGVGLVCIIYSGKKPRVNVDSASGASKWLNIKFYKSTKACLNTLKKQGFQLYGALVDPDSEPIWKQDLTGKVAVVMGNEVNGLSKIAQKLVDKNLYIPMFGLTESFNVSVSAGIFLYEVARQIRQLAD